MKVNFKILFNEHILLVYIDSIYT